MSVLKFIFFVSAIIFFPLAHASDPTGIYSALLALFVIPVLALLNLLIFLIKPKMTKDALLFIFIIIWLLVLLIGVGDAKQSFHLGNYIMICSTFLFIPMNMLKIKKSSEKLTKKEIITIIASGVLLSAIFVFLTDVKLPSSTKTKPMGAFIVSIYEHCALLKRNNCDTVYEIKLPHKTYTTPYDRIELNPTKTIITILDKAGSMYFVDAKTGKDLFEISKDKNFLEWCGHYAFWIKFGEDKEFTIGKISFAENDIKEKILLHDHEDSNHLMSRLRGCTEDNQHLIYFSKNKNIIL